MTPPATSPGPTPAQWLEGARPRTLPAAVSPVLAGTGVAAFVDHAVWWKALLALLVALALQVGVNYANDYSDGIRGTDADRVGPLRLVGSGVASPKQVKTAAFASFGVAMVLGLVLVVTSAWWLLLVGALCVVAAWFYTGGSQPYGYHALGEVMVFVFFGLVAVLGTTYVQTGTAPLAAWFAAVGVGSLACAILVANNVRDIPTDREVGKRTLAVVLGDRQSRYLYVLLVWVALATLLGLAIATSGLALLGLLFLLPAGAGHPPGPHRYDGPGTGPRAAADRSRRADLRARDLRRAAPRRLTRTHQASGQGGDPLDHRRAREVLVLDLGQQDPCVGRHLVGRQQLLDLVEHGARRERVLVDLLQQLLEQLHPDVVLALGHAASSCRRNQSGTSAAHLQTVVRSGSTQVPVS